MANFILDTGTNRTIVDESIAKDLLLNHVDKGLLVAPGGTIESALVEIDSFCVGGYESGKVVAAVQDLRIYSRKYGTGISMVLGTDFLKRFIVHIDYDGKVAALMNKSAKPSRLVATIPFRLENDLPLVEAKLSDSVKTELIIDTGNFLEVLVYDDLSERLQLEEPISTRRIGGAAASHPTKFGKIPWIEIGTYRIHSVSIGLHPLTVPNVSNTSYKPGLLGNGILENYIVEIDYLASVMRLYDRARVLQ